MGLRNIPTSTPAPLASLVVAREGMVAKMMPVRWQGPERGRASRQSDKWSCRRAKNLTKPRIM